MNSENSSRKGNTFSIFNLIFYFYFIEFQENGVSYENSYPKSGAHLTLLIQRKYQMLFFLSRSRVPESHVPESTRPRVHTSSSPHVLESTRPRVYTSPSQNVSESTRFRAHTSPSPHVSESTRPRPLLVTALKTYLFHFTTKIISLSKSCSWVLLRDTNLLRNLMGHYPCHFT